MIAGAEDDVGPEFADDGVEPEQRAIGGIAQLAHLDTRRNLVRQRTAGIADHQRHPPPGARPAIGHAQQRPLDAAALERLGEAQNMRCGGGLIGHGDPGWG